ncbi:splicing factor 3B subunit 1 [Acrasis kona]|uniref:Splicing factor 3B subunit 1 n=1 Tax=Acrasis kona TaxID=1008807 RepID=A0AAW2YWH9_9EUKA
MSGLGSEDRKRKSQWEEQAEEDNHPINTPRQTKRSRWDQTPQNSSSQTPQSTPSVRKQSRWDQTPTAPSATPSAQSKSRWDETPVDTSGTKKSRWDETPIGSTTTLGGATPVGTSGMMTPTAAQLAQTNPELYNQLKIEQDLDYRNRPLTDEDLDNMLPSDGYEIMEVPASYIPKRTQHVPSSTPLPGGETPYAMPEDRPMDAYGVQTIQPGPDMPELKPEDMKYFGGLLEEKDENVMTDEEKKERKIMTLLLKIKNGTPPMRKLALRYITLHARDLGAEPLFKQILPLLMAPTLEDQERHLLVKVIDRILYKLDDLVRPFVRNILMVIEPLLIEEDYFARVEGREIISNLAKAAGLPTMIATMRPNIDNHDDFVRNTTARAFAVVASALGIPSLLPFLKAVCQSKKSWQARHTGIKIVQQIAVLMGCAILPHLRQLVEIVEQGLKDSEIKVKTMTALAIAALAEASAPYGIESFDTVLRPLWDGLKKHGGKSLAAFLKAIGFIIPLMDPIHASHYTKTIMDVVIRQFSSPDEEMKKIVLKVVKQCVSAEGIEPNFVLTKILQPFFASFWIRRMALERRNYKQLVETTIEIGVKVGTTPVLDRLVPLIKDESEPFRRMVIEATAGVINKLGSASIDHRQEELLMDGLLYAFTEQVLDDSPIILNSIQIILNALGTRCKPYLAQIAGIISVRLNNKMAKVRQHAADLINRVAAVMNLCGEESKMGHLGLILYEYLGEEYPEVLGSILGALKGIVTVIGMDKMTPPIKDLLPRLTPILKNRHEKVQENCIELVGRIADRGSSHVPGKEWMRICFELLDLLKAHRKSIRRAAINTFGYIANAIGPSDVLATLLNNLKVQERQNRVCTTVAIAIVADTCSPFTVLPALMNEYRVPELNVQNGVLKSMSFLFEYIGEMGKDYIYAVTPLLEDALMDRDLVHRQTACTVVKHMALGVYGMNCEDALVHLLNYVWPNVFETSPHVINAVMEAIEGLRVALGPCIMMMYVLQGLYHPSRRVRNVYWKIYNILYIGNQDALTPVYPVLPNDPDNNYHRGELFYCL